MWQVWEAGHHPQECSEAEAGVGEVAGGSRTLEPEGPAEPDGVRWRGAVQKTQAAHQFHAPGDRSSEHLLQEERFAHRPRNYRNCQRAELWQRSGSGVVLQQATDAEKHKQNQRVPGAAVTFSPARGTLSAAAVSAGHTNVYEPFEKVKRILNISYCILSLCCRNICVVSTQTKLHGHFIGNITNTIIVIQS